MRQKLLVSVIGVFLSCTFVWAQEWSKEDSIWLKNVLDGKEELKINEATKKAIEEGLFIVPLWMRNNNTLSLPEIEKGLDGAGLPDDSLKINNFDPLSMPPAVFALYILYIDKMDSAYEARYLQLTDEERKKLEDLVPEGSQSFYPYTSNYQPGYTLVHDFNHLLSMVFSSHYRRLAYNRKHATAYKNYNNDGIMANPIRFSENDRKQLNRLVNQRRPTIKVSTGQKFNGIDD